jgi:hypothetical protein
MTIVVKEEKQGGMNVEKDFPENVWSGKEIRLAINLLIVLQFRVFQLKAYMSISFLQYVLHTLSKSNLNGFACELWIALFLLNYIVILLFSMLKWQAACVMK